jgi:hypothetical protein
MNMSKYIKALQLCLVITSDVKVVLLLSDFIYVA